MLQLYFGPGLLIYVGDILKSDPPMQAGSTGLGRLALDPVSKIATTDALRAIALIFRFIIAVLQILKSATAAPRPVAVVADRGSSSAALRITGRNDGSSFHHQNNYSIRGAGAVLDAFGNDESLLWLQINRAILEIDDKVPLQDKEELV